MPSPDEHDPTPAEAESLEFLRRVAHVPDSSLGARDEGVAAPPARIGRFVVLDLLGKGGMGVVYAAYDPDLNRKVAIKLLRVGAHESAGAGRARLMREAQALARLSHPNVVPVYDVGLHDDGVFMAMELVDGVTLGQWSTQARRSWREVRYVYVDAGRGLAAAHEARLVHRDFKPDNVLIGRDGRVRVTDFGLAREAAAAEPQAPASEATADPSKLATVTVAGALAGTPAYMAPELFEGQAADARSDQWSFCAALYKALYGEHPFARATFKEAQEAVRSGEVNPPPPGARVPAWMRRVVVRGLLVDRSARWPSLAALLDALGRDRRLRRREAVGLAVIAVIAAGAAGLTYMRRSSAPPEACAGAASLIEGIWDAPARARVAGAFAATGVPYAAEAAGAVGRALDAYAAGWVAMHDETCRATHVLGVQPEAVLDARMLCLNRRLGELDRLARLLMSADARTVELAPQAAMGLAPLAECGEPGLAVPEAGVRDVVVAARGRIDDARTLRSAGRYPQARAIAAQVVVEARALGYPPLVGEALVVLGDVENVLGESKLAQVTLTTAAGAALAAGDVRTACNAWLELGVVTGRDLAAFDEGHRWLAMAQAAAASINPHGPSSAEAARRQAVIYMEQGLYGEAETAFRRALALREALGGPDSLEVGMLLTALGNVARHRGELALAARELGRALEIQRRALGEGHPYLADVYLKLANTAYAAGRYQEARTHATEALALVERGFGPNHREVGYALTTLAMIHQALGEYDDAIAKFRRALAIAEGPSETPELRVAELLSAVAETYYRSGDYAAALDATGRAERIRARLVGPDNVMLAANLMNQAVILVELSRYTEAGALYTRALAIFEKQLGAEHWRVGVTLVNQGDVLRHMGDAAAALAAYRRGLTILEKSLGKDHAYVAAALNGLGRTLFMLGRVGEALPALERALELRERGPDDPDLAETRFALARALPRSGGPAARARALAERALARYRAGGAPYRRQTAEITSWLAARR